MSKKYSWLRVVPLYGGIIVLFLSLIKGEINNTILWKIMVKVGLLRVALPFFLIMIFLKLIKPLSFSSVVIPVVIIASIIILGFFSNKCIFDELAKIS